MTLTHVIRRKLTNLTQYIKKPQPLTNYTLGEYSENYFIKRTGERMVQLIVENMVDISAMIIAEAKHSPPKDYYISFEIMGELGYLPLQFAQELAPSAGMRNRIVHEYDKIKDQIIFSNIPKLLHAAREYIKFINSSLQ